MFFLFCIMLQVQAETFISFDELPKLIKNNNLEIKSRKLDVDAAESVSFGVARSYLPSLELEKELNAKERGEEFFVKDPEFKAHLKFNIFNRGEDRLRANTSQLNFERDKNIYSKSLSEQTKWAGVLYWNLIYYNEMLSLTEEMQGINLQNKNSADKRIKSGLATQSDRLEFELTEIELNHQLIEMQLKIKTLKEELGFVIGLSEFSVPKKLIHTHDIEKIISQSSKVSEHFYKPIKLESDRFDLKSHVAKLYWAPKVDIIVGYEEYDKVIRLPSLNIKDDLKSETTISLNLSFNLEQASKALRQSQAFASKAMALNLKHKYKMQLYEVKIQNKIKELRLRHSFVHKAERAIKIAQKYYKMTKNEYVRGVKNSPDMLGAAERLYSIQIERLELIRSYQVTKTEYLALIN